MVNGSLSRTINGTFIQYSRIDGIDSLGILIN